VLVRDEDWALVPLALGEVCWYRAKRVEESSAGPVLLGSLPEECEVKC
jgi:hypothetical protein